MDKLYWLVLGGDIQAAVVWLSSTAWGCLRPRRREGRRPRHRLLVGRADHSAIFPYGRGPRDDRPPALLARAAPGRVEVRGRRRAPGCADARPRGWVRASPRPMSSRRADPPIRMGTGRPMRSHRPSPSAISSATMARPPWTTNDGAGIASGPASRSPRAARPPRTTAAPGARWSTSPSPCRWPPARGTSRSRRGSRPWPPAAPACRRATGSAASTSSEEWVFATVPRDAAEPLAARLYAIATHYDGPAGGSIPFRWSTRIAFVPRPRAWSRPKAGGPASRSARGSTRPGGSPCRRPGSRPTTRTSTIALATAIAGGPACSA